MARPGESGSPYSYGLMNIYVFAPLPAAAGQYSFQVKATSDVPQKTTIPMQINPCVPRTTCPVPNLCGPVSDDAGEVWIAALALRRLFKQLPLSVRIVLQHRIE
jgi:hypothetical protein